MLSVVVAFAVLLEVGVELAVHLSRADIQRAVVAGLYSDRGLSRARYGVGLQNTGVAVAGAFARDDPEAETLRGVKRSRLQAAVIPVETLGPGVFRENLAIVRALRLSSD